MFENEPKWKLTSLKYIQMCFWWWAENSGGRAFLCAPAPFMRVSGTGRCCSSEVGEPSGRRCISWVTSSRFRDLEPSGFFLRSWGCILEIDTQNSSLWYHHDLTGRAAQNVCATFGRIWAPAWPDSTDTMRYQLLILVDCIDFPATSVD